jgi:UDP-N-acetylglucosamine 1-carboxyvinyltransferase
MHFLIETSRNLKGVYIPQGNKNEALPVIAATILAGSECRLTNLPNIIDVDVMLQLLQSVGCELSMDLQSHQATIKAASEFFSHPDPILSSRIRGSLLLAAPLLARYGKVVLQRPGGDRIGRRRIDTHLSVFEQLGAKIDVSTNEVVLSLDKNFKSTDIFLDEASVMATENALMAAASAEGITTIENAACEPHVQQLAKMLNSMGASIEGIGTNRLRINGLGGVNGFRGVTHDLIEDHIEVGSIITLAAATDSDITIPGIHEANYRMTQRVFQKLGLEFSCANGTIHVPDNQKLEIDYDNHGAIPRIHDAPWPGFPPDLSSSAVILACCSKGSVMIHEWMFESRLYWVDSLIGMGARITQCDPHRVLVNGGQPLYASTLHSPDIRAGMSLLIAALRAEGITRINNITQIDRGYETIDERLIALGAKIQRVND